MYSRSLNNLQHSNTKGSGSCPVVSRRLVGPVKTFAAKRIAALSFDGQSSSEVCAISINARKPGILWRRALCPTERIAKYNSSGRPIAYVDRKKWGGVSFLVSDFVCHKACCGHPQDDEDDLAVFLDAARCIEVGKLGLGA